MVGIMRAAILRLWGPATGRRFLSMSEMRRHNPAGEDTKSCSKAETQAEKLRYLFGLYRVFVIFIVDKKNSTTAEVFSFLLI